MSLTALSARLTRAAVAGGGIVNLLTAIHAAGTAAIDFWGDAIVASDVWTWTQVVPVATLEAVRGTPPVDAIGSRLIFAGRTAVPTPAPTYYGSDTWGNSYLYASANIDSGAFATWNAALPFTSGRFSGYMRTIDASAVTFTYVWMIQTQETAWVFGETAAGAIYLLGHGGAFVDPESDAILDCETDGRRYGLTTGGSVALSATFLTGSWWPIHSASANAVHFATFIPRSSGMLSVATRYVRTANPGATANVKPSGKPVLDPYMLNDGNGNDLGRWREVYGCQIGRLGRRFRPASTTYAIIGPAYSPTADDDCLACGV